jgi:CheY-like chemotaxis protein
VTPDTVLVADADAQALRAAATALADAGYLVMQAASFADARSRLATARPDVLITSVRLGGYNGLQLVIGSRLALPRLVCIVTHAVLDPVLQAAASSHNATFLVQPVAWELFLGVLGRLLEARGDRPRPTRPRRRPRSAPEREVAAALGLAPGCVVDLSYGGVRLELSQRIVEPPRATQALALPEEGLALRARAVWTCGAGADGPWLCGVEIDDPDPIANRAWRAFVDRAR